MAITRRIVLTGISCSLVITLYAAASNDPFPPGYSMGNNGTILRPNSQACRQPWIPAAMLIDSMRFGAALCGIDYYDAMDNLEGQRIDQVLFGGWAAWRRLLLKGSWAYFNGLGVYEENRGYCSIGLRIIKWLRASVELTGFRSGLIKSNDRPVSLLYGGVSCLLHGSYGALSLCCNHIPCMRTQRLGFEEPLSISMGLHSLANQYGAQGIVATMTQDNDWTFRCSIGEEFRVTDWFSLCGAVALSPFGLYFGCTVARGGPSASISFANIAPLGWSRGLSLDYAHR